jgi:hypothetical protein
MAKRRRRVPSQQPARRVPPQQPGHPVSPQQPQSLRAPLLAAFRAAVIFVCHMALAALIIICIWAFWRLFHFLWGAEDPRLFDVFPLRYLFDAADAGVVLVFAWYGVTSAVAAFRD